MCSRVYSALTQGPPNESFRLFGFARGRKQPQRTQPRGPRIGPPMAADRLGDKRLRRVDEQQKGGRHTNAPHPHQPERYRLLFPAVLSYLPHSVRSGPILLWTYIEGDIDQCMLLAVMFVQTRNLH